MVKRWIVILMISILLVLGGVIETRYTQNSLSWLINSLESLEIELTENKDKIDQEPLIDKVYAIDSDWDERLDILKCLVWHSGVKDIEIGLSRIAVYVEENDYTEAYAECAALIDYAAHYLDDFKITLENIL